MPTIRKSFAHAFIAAASAWFALAAGAVGTSALETSSIATATADQLAKQVVGRGSPTAQEDHVKDTRSGGTASAPSAITSLSILWQAFPYDVGHYDPLYAQRRFAFAQPRAPPKN